jgi:pyruvate kinase
MIYGCTEKTKIVATMGKSSCSYETLKMMAEAGMDVCRVNFSHAKKEDLIDIIDKVSRINKEMNVHIGILADLQGPKIRLGEFENEGFDIEKGEQIIITTDEIKGNKQRIPIRYENFPKDVQAGEDILIDDGKLALKVIETNRKNEVKLQAKNSGRLAPRKGVSLPQSTISLPSLTEKDLHDLEFILTQDVHWIALSFVRTADDIQHLRDLIKASHKENKPKIIAKIEKPQALANIESIIDASDGLMVARGDLGIETPMEQVPIAQKNIIRLCRKKGKPVIVATEMMESMIQASRPTRAEVNDVANAVFDGADALMLSGETSVGIHPTETISIMRQIILTIEKAENIYYKHLPHNQSKERFTTDSLLYTACELAKDVNAASIVVFTYSGYSVMRLSGYRPKASILMFSNREFLIQQFSLLWGVKGVLSDIVDNVDDLIDFTEKKLLQRGYAKEGDRIINVLSTPFCTRGASNTLRMAVI